MKKNSKISYINFDKMYESDRRTDGHRMTAKAALDLSVFAARGKNRQIAQEHLLNHV